MGFPTRPHRLGLKILTSPAFTPLDILRKNYDAYHAEWRATHGTGDGAEMKSLPENGTPPGRMAAHPNPGRERSA